MAEREAIGARRYVFPGGVPVQVLLWTGQRDSLVVDGNTARMEIPNNAELIEITAVENCFINFGDVTVVATSTIATDGSRLFAAGVQIVPVPLDPATDEPYTYIAVIQQTTGGICQIEQLA